jgi:hypothetical protein
MQRDTVFCIVGILAGLAMVGLIAVFPHIPVYVGHCLLWGSIFLIVICCVFLARSVKQLTYDTAMWKAVPHIAEQTGVTKENYFQKTRAQIEEKALAGGLIVWGRKQLDSDPGWVEKREFSGRITSIPPEYWAISKISPYATVEPISTKVPCTQPADRGTWPKERNAYADLRVNWKQLKKLWPKKKSGGRVHLKTGNS